MDARLAGLRPDTVDGRPSAARGFGRRALSRLRPRRRVPLRRRNASTRRATRARSSSSRCATSSASTRNVIVQATCHGADNRALVDALRRGARPGPRRRDRRPDVSDDELAETARRRRARRCVSTTFDRLVDPEPDEYYHRIVEKIAPLGLARRGLLRGRGPRRNVGFLHVSSGPTSSSTTWAVPTSPKSSTVRSSRASSRLMDEHENFWCQGHVPRAAQPRGPAALRDVVPFAHRVIERFPDRVLWGTDWPHPNLQDVHARRRRDSSTSCREMAPTPELQRKLLVDNPMRLYWRDDE